MTKIGAIKRHCWSRDNLLVVLVVLLFMSGRFTLERVGVGGLYGSIPIYWVLLVVLFAVVFDEDAPQFGGARYAVWGLSLFVGLLLLSALVWRYETGGQITIEAMAGMWVLPLFALVAFKKVATVTVLRKLAVCLAVIGIIYAGGGLVSGLGPGERMSAFTAGSGVFARVVTMGILSVLYLSQRHLRWWVLALPIMAAAVVLSGSRVMWIGALIAVAFWLVLAMREWEITRRSGVVLTMLLVLGVVVAVVWHPDVTFTRSIGLTIQEGYTGGRLEMWGDAVRLIRENPWFGTGVGSFPVLTQPIPSAYGSAWTEPSWYPHNLFLDAGVAIGVGGIVLLACIIGWFLWQSWKRWDGSLLSVTLLSLFVAQFIAQMGSGTFYDGRWMWLFLLLLAVRRERTPVAKPRGLTALPQR